MFRSDQEFDIREFCFILFKEKLLRRVNDMRKGSRFMLNTPNYHVNCSTAHVLLVFGILKKSVT
jgi:hypothetical protein